MIRTTAKTAASEPTSRVAVRASMRPTTIAVAREKPRSANGESGATRAQKYATAISDASVRTRVAMSASASVRGCNLLDGSEEAPRDVDLGHEVEIEVLQALFG